MSLKSRIEALTTQISNAKSIIIILLWDLLSLLGGGNFNTVEYTVYYNGRIKFNPGTIQSIVNWMNQDLVNKVIVWCVGLVRDLLNPSWLSQN